jgi:DNA-binding LacI/PurR family transcriptional regulator
MTESTLINLSATHTKSSIVAKAIAHNIRNGVLKPGDRVQTVRALANKFSVSLTVVQAALRELEDSKLIERRANSVALVRDSSNTVQNAEKQIMLCLQSSGHVFGEVYGLISNGLISRGFLPMTMDHNKVAKNETDQNFKQNISDILQSGIKSVILSGMSYWHYPFMEEHPDVRAVFLYVLDYAGPMPERAVLFDNEAAIYQTTAHLASRGYKRIMLCTHRTEPHAINIETINRHQSMQIKNGYERALREYNIATYDRVLNNDDSWLKALTEILKSKYMPDAIVCDTDYTAMQVEMLVLKCGMKVPEDIAVTGAFNTPWSDLSPVPLTTVTYDWNELARIAIKLALEDEPEQKINYMKPTLIVKKSTGGER